MKQYIGTKIIMAEAMDECTFLKIHKGEDVSNRETRPGFKVVYADGYVSWSPAEAFKAYRPCDAMTFGLAIEAMRDGYSVGRRGWNGKGMYLVLQKGYPGGIPINKNTSEATGLPEGTIRRFNPYIMMKTATGEFVPWFASQTDMLAEDWEIVDGERQSGTYQYTGKL